MTEIISSDLRLAILADGVVSRTYEVFAYDFNISNYTAMLSALPADEWPADLVDYKGIPTDQLPATLPMEKVLQIGDYSYRDQLRVRVRSEEVEKAKVERVLVALKAQIPTDQYAAAVAAATDRYNAKTAAVAG